MLRYFRINDPYRLLALFAIILILNLPAFINSTGITRPELNSFVLGEKVLEGHSLYTEIIDSTPPLASWFYGLCDWVFGRNLTLRHIAAFVILFLQSAFLGILLIDKKAFPENTYIPSLLFSMLTLVSFDVLALTSDIAAFGFLLLALNALLTEIEFRVQRDETIFNLGLFISIATLFNFSYLIYLPGFFILLILFTRNSLRKYLLMLVGFVLPHLLLISANFLTGDGGALWEFFYVPNLSFASTSLISLKSILILCAAPLFYLFISIFILNRDAHLTKYQSQVLQAMLVLFIVALVQVYFAPELRPQSLLPLAPSVSFFFTHFLLLIRKKRFATMHLWILLLGILSMNYLARYEKWIPVDYSRLLIAPQANFISGKKILVLENNPSGYIHNVLSPPFVDWRLTKKIFEEPQYYEHVLLVSTFFKRDAPDVILDPENLMNNYFDRIPWLKSKYIKSANDTWVLTNN